MMRRPWGATGGLREAAFIDEFGANGLKFSICQPDFSGAMSGIGKAIARKLKNLCLDVKLVDTDLVAPGLQPDCAVHYRRPAPDPNNPTNVIYQEDPQGLPLCPDGATSGSVVQDCWQLTNDLTQCPVNGQVVTVLRTAAEVAAGPLSPGTMIGMTCQTCITVGQPGCNY
jgi:hypothetical protein